MGNDQHQRDTDSRESRYLITSQLNEDLKTVQSRGLRAPSPNQSCQLAQFYIGVTTTTKTVPDNTSNLVYCSRSATWWFKAV